MRLSLILGRDSVLHTLSVNADVVTVDGEAYDFGPLPGRGASCELGPSPSGAEMSPHPFSATWRHLVIRGLPAAGIGRRRFWAGEVVRSNKDRMGGGWRLTGEAKTGRASSLLSGSFV